MASNHCFLFMSNPFCRIASGGCCVMPAVHSKPRAGEAAAGSDPSPDRRRARRVALAQRRVAGGQRAAPGRAVAVPLCPDGCETCVPKRSMTAQRRTRNGESTPIPLSGSGRRCTGSTTWRGIRLRWWGLVAGVVDRYLRHRGAVAARRHLRHQRLGRAPAHRGLLRRLVRRARLSDRGLDREPTARAARQRPGAGADGSDGRRHARAWRRARSWRPSVSSPRRSRTRCAIRSASCARRRRR